MDVGGSNPLTLTKSNHGDHSSIGDRMIRRKYSRSGASISDEALPEDKTPVREYLFRKLCNIVIGLMSPCRMRKCEWCGVRSAFKRKRIWSIANPAGSVESVCDECVKDCKGA